MDMAGHTNPELVRLRADALQAGRLDEAAAIAREIEARERHYETGEMLDIYDDSLRHAGVKERGRVHLDGDWHRSFHCWLVSPARRTLVVQRRAMTKATFPGALDAAVAGHYRAGEGVREGCREADEELGLTLDPDRLIPLGRTVDISRHGVLIDREVADVFLYTTDVALEALRPDAAEVAAVLEVAVKAAGDLFTGVAEFVPALSRAADGTARSVRIRADAFTTHTADRYYARLALQARRVADGQPPLLV